MTIIKILLIIKLLFTGAAIDCFSETGELGVASALTVALILDGIALVTIWTYT